MNKYKYTSTDNSKFGARFSKYIALPISKMLVNRIRPNHVTVGSFIAMNLMWISIALLGIQPITFILSAILLFIYLTLDCVDGILARLTNSESALGEFSEHSVDIICLGLCLSLVLYLFKIDISWLVIGSLWLIFISVCKIFNDQKMTSHIVFGLISGLEMGLFAVLLLLSAAYPPLYQFYLSEGPFSLSKIAFVLLIFLLPNLQTFIRLARDEIYPKQFFLYIGLSITFFYSLSAWGMIHQILFLIPYSTYFIVSIIRSHLLNESYPYPDIIAPVYVLLSPLFTTNDLYLMGLPISYLWARTLFTYFKTAGRIIQRDMN